MSNYGKTPPSTNKGKKIAKRIGKPIHYSAGEGTYSILKKHEDREEAKLSKKSWIARTLQARGAHYNAMKSAEAPVAAMKSLSRGIKAAQWKNKVRKAGKKISSKSLFGAGK